MVRLIQVDVIRSEAAEASLHRAHDPAARPTLLVRDLTERDGRCRESNVLPVARW
jgi:hypothetical protein